MVSCIMFVIACLDYASYVTQLEAEAKGVGSQRMTNHSRNTFPESLVASKLYAGAVGCTLFIYCLSAGVVE